MASKFSKHTSRALGSRSAVPALLSSAGDLAVKGILWFLYFSNLLRPFLYVANQIQWKKNGNGRMLFPFLARREERTVQILVYHRINDDRNPYFPGVPTKVFERQMRYLADSCRTVSLEECVERIRKNDIPPNTVSVTFDDGYRDNYIHAYPVLKKYSIPATVFLATGSIGSGNPLWHDLVFSAFTDTKASALENFGNPKATHSLVSSKDRSKALESVLCFLRAQICEDRDRWIEILREKLGIANRTGRENLMMGWEEIREMLQGGISFGSHTVTHPVLTRVGLEQVIFEASESKKAIEDRLGITVTSFAYPNGKPGDFNDEIKNVLKGAGYACAVTTIFGGNRRGRDLFELRRGTPWEEDLPSFAGKLAWYQWRSG